MNSVDPTNNPTRDVENEAALVAVQQSINAANIPNFEKRMIPADDVKNLVAAAIDAAYIARVNTNKGA